MSTLKPLTQEEIDQLSAEMPLRQTDLDELEYSYRIRARRVFRAWVEFAFRAKFREERDGAYPGFHEAVKEALENAAENLVLTDGFFYILKRAQAIGHRTAFLSLLDGAVCVEDAQNKPSTLRGLDIC